MNCGVLYMLVGDNPTYRLVLLASLATLRKHYAGPVALLTDQAWIPSGVKRIQIAVSVTGLGPAGTIGDCWGVKASTWKHSPFDSTLCLDADTLIAGDVSPLFLAAGNPEILVTQHANWRTGSGQMKSRLQSLSIQGCIHHSRIDKLIAADVPAINSGVHAYTKATEILEEWPATTNTLSRWFIHDEMALQLLLPDYPHRVVDDRWNCHPLWSKRKAEEVVIWHCCRQAYGDPRCRDLWFDTVAQLYADNVDGIREWWPGNPRLWRS